MTYQCTNCGLSGFRLYRPYQSSADKLLCANCAAANQKRRINPEAPGTIGWMVAAIPDEHGNFWGYTSVPDDRMVWWYSMPLRPEQTDKERVDELLRVYMSMANSATFWMSKAAGK